MPMGGRGRTVLCMSRSLTILAAAVAGLFGAAALAAPSALAAAKPKTAAGPYGVGVVAPPSTLACDADLRLGVRFTKAARKAGVRTVQVRLRGTKLGLTVPFRAGRFTTVRLSPPCGATATVEYRVTRRAPGARRQATTTKRYRVRVAARPAAPTGPGGVPQEPGGPAELPAASSTDPDGVRTWRAMADLRTGGTRKGQTCVQTVVDGPGGRTVAGTTFCGLPDEDAVVAAARLLDGRTVLAGVASAQVTALAVVGPFGTQALPLSSKEDASDEGGEFVAVYDAAQVGAAQLQLQATLADGRVLTFADVRALHWRTAAGARI